MSLRGAARAKSIRRNVAIPELCLRDMQNGEAQLRDCRAIARNDIFSFAPCKAPKSFPIYSAPNTAK